MALRATLPAASARASRHRSCGGRSVAVSGDHVVVRAYRALLRLYPSRLRAEYGPDMVQLVRDQCADEPAWRVGGRIVVDVALTLPAQHLETHMSRSPNPIRSPPVRRGGSRWDARSHRRSNESHGLRAHRYRAAARRRTHDRPSCTISAQLTRGAPKPSDRANVQTMNLNHRARDREDYRPNENVRRLALLERDDNEIEISW